MRKRQAAASHSILLDYVGASYLEVVYRAAKHRHWRVILVVVGSALISVCTIAATSLWTIRVETLSSAVSLRATTSMGRAFTSTPPQYLVGYFGKLLYDVPAPNWMFDGHASSSFRNISNINDTDTELLSATVDALSATLVCEPAYINTDTLIVSWRDCKQKFDLHKSEEMTYYGTMHDMVCGSARAGVIAIYKFNGSDLVATTAAACSPAYTRSEFSVTVNPSTFDLAGTPTLLSSQRGVTLPHGDGLLYWIFATNNITSLHSMAAFDHDQNVFDSPWTWPHPILQTTNLSQYDVQLGTWINLLGRCRDLTEANLSDAQKLAALSTDVFHDMFPYVAQAVYEQPSQSLLNGTRTITIPRLVSKDLSVRIAQAALIMLSVIAILLWLIHPKTDLWQNPESLLSMAVLLASSRRAAACLIRTGAMDDSELGNHLKDVLCFTAASGGGGRLVLSGWHNAEEAYHSSTVRRWKPFPLSILAKSSLVLSIAAAIAGLEVLLLQSVHSNGLVDIGVSHFDHYSWTYSAPAILFLLGLWLSSFDFAIRATEPYRLLSDAPRPARFLAFAPLSSGEYTIIPRSISQKTFLIVLAAFASLLLPAAKIVVAGLFAEMENTVSVATMLPLNTRFNHTCDAIWDFGLWTYTVSAGFHLNRPTWATREYAVGSIGLPNAGKSTIVA
ncbi:hypothetical protein EXIGLDRAFT_840206, partial [Exidia glandulosa HHB12029]